MTQHDSPRPPRFCPNCGAHNLALAATCTVCGQSLGKREDFAKLWGGQSQSQSADETAVIDLYPTYDSSSQSTTPFTQTRPFDPNDYRPAPNKSGKQGAAVPVTAAMSGSPSAPPPPPPFVAAPVSSRRKGPPGCVLGCLAMVLIAIVAGLIAWDVARNAVSDRVEDEISVGVTNELQKIDDLPVDTSGQIVLTEADVNQSVQENADLYTPVENVEVTILADGFRVRFDLYGVSSTFRGDLEVRDGTIRVVDPVLSGPAGKVINADEIAAIFENETGALLSRFDLKPVDVLLRKGTLVISTEKNL